MKLIYKLKEINMREKLTNITLFCVLLLFSMQEGFAQSIAFPANSGVVNVKTQYGAVGDGVTDDTQAIQKAINENRWEFHTLYFPDGTYLVSTTLDWGAGRTHLGPNVHGESRDGVVIKLKDNSMLNGPVIRTAKSVSNADHFHCRVKNITINVGSGNPAASGIDFYSNNTGSLRDVKITSDDGQGFAGINSSQDQNGPCLFKNIEIEGFDYGVYITGGGVNSLTFENITVRNQKIYGFRTELQVVNVHNLVSDNSVPAVWSGHDQGSLTLVNGTFTGGSSENPAIIHRHGILFLRDVTLSGYGQALKSSVGASIGGSTITEYAYPEIHSLFPTPAKSLRLPVEPIPELPWDDPSEWVNIEDYGATPGGDSGSGDDTEAIQAAIDAGATTVYIPNRNKGSGNRFRMDGTVYLRGNVRRIVCVGPIVAGNGTLVLQDGTHPEVEVTGWYSWDAPEIVHESSRTLIVRSSGFHKVTCTGTGKTFLEDYVGGIDIQNASHKLWGVQANTEAKGEAGRNLVNMGATAWIFGMKTEDVGKISEVYNNGSTEILGLLIYANAACGSNHVNPAFIIGDASANAKFSVAGFRQRRFCSGLGYEKFVVETRNGTTNTLLSTSTSQNGSALYVGYPGSASAPSAPGALATSGVVNNRLTLTWTDNSANEDGFKIERREGSGDYVQVGVLGHNMNSFIDNNVNPSSTYSYRVRAYNVGGNSPYSSAVTVATPALTTPSDPSGMSATANGWAEILLTWTDNSSNEDGFKIERRPSGGTFTEVATTGPNVTSFTEENGLTANSTYEYRVRAYNVAGNSGYTGVDEATTGDKVSYGVGVIRWDIWYDIEGNPVDQLKNSPLYPDSPSESGTRDKLEGPIDIADNYGTRMSGWVYAPTSGTYTFWVASDNSSELWLSSDESAANKVKIAEVSGDRYTGFREWTRYASQKSAPIYLEAGSKHYIEVVHKTGGGNDHVSVAWNGPGFGREVVDGIHLEPSGDFCGVNLSSESVNFSTSAGSRSITVTTTESFTASEEQDWISTSISGNTLTITVTENTAPYPRTGVVTTNGCKVKTIDVLQEGTSGLQATYGNGGIPGSGNPWEVAASGPTRIELENYNTGGQGVAYNDSDVGNEGGAYRTSQGVDIQTTSDTGGGYNLGWLTSTEWLNYTINVASAGTYDLTFRVASASEGGIVRALAGPNANEFTALTGDIAVPVTGDWQTWENVTVSVALNAGPQLLRVAFGSGGFNISYLELERTGGSANALPTASITSPTEGASFTVGSSISIAADASDSDGTISQVEFFVNGNSIGTDETSPYAIAWTPEAAGTFSITASATDNSNAAVTSEAVSITVNEAETVSADTLYAKNRNGGYRITVPGQIVQLDGPGSWIVFNDVNMGDFSKISTQVAVDGGGRRIEFRLDAPTGTLISTLNITSTGNWDTFVSQTSDITNNPGGVHDLYLVAYGGNPVCKVNRIILSGGGPQIPAGYPVIHSFSAENHDGPATNLIDDNTAGASRWAANGFPQWIIVDYGATVPITGTRVWTYQNRAYKYKVELSTDLDFSGDLVVDRLNNSSNTQPISNDFSAKNARYAKITIVGASGYTGTWSTLTEFQVLVNGELMATASGANAGFSAGSISSDPGSSATDVSPTVYPNPTVNGELQISGLAEGASIMVYSLAGKKLYEKKTERGHFNLNLPNIRGTVLVTISQNGTVTWHKVIVQ